MQLECFLFLSLLQFIFLRHHLSPTELGFFFFFFFTDDLILLAVSINPGFNLNWLDLGFCWGLNISHEAIQSGFYFHENGSLSSQFVIYRESNCGAGDKAPKVDLFS